MPTETETQTTKTTNPESPQASGSASKNDSTVGRATDSITFTLDDEALAAVQNDVNAGFEAQQKEIEALKAHNARITREALLDQLSTIKKQPKEKLEDKYKNYSNEVLSALAAEYGADTSYLNFRAEGEEEKPPLVFYAGTMKNGKWEDEEAE